MIIIAHLHNNMCIASISHNSISEPRHSAAMFYNDSSNLHHYSLCPSAASEAVYRSMVEGSKPTDAWTASLAPYYLRTPCITGTKRRRKKR